VRDFRFAGWISAVVLWACLPVLIWRLTGRHVAATCFLTVVAFAATHLGFYSYNHSSEILSFGCLSIIALWLWKRDRLDAIDLAGTGTLSACLVLIRPHLSIYLPLVIGVLAWRLRQEKPRPSAGRWGFYATLFVGPVAAALTQVLWVNRWMTGSAFGSTYSFGNHSFRSLDLADPEWLAVLLHPWHGLLAYHPFYALAMLLLGIGIFRGTGPSRWLHVGIAITLAIHLYLQASWYCWWLGLWSLGTRGFGVAAVLLTPVVAHAFCRARPRERLAMAAALGLCASWSLLLMMQGNTNFLRWADLASAQAATALEVARILPWAVVMAAVAYGLARRRPVVDRLLLAGCALLAVLVLDFLARLAFEIVVGGDRGVGLVVVRVALTSLAPLVALFELRHELGGASHATPWARAIGVAAVVAVFACVGLLFVRLAVDAERRIASGGIPGGASVVAFQVPEVEACYREYLAVPGFHDKKEALRGFLDERDVE
jgi:hypothetical protein